MPSPPPSPSARSGARLFVILLGLAVLFCGFTALGVWQLHRLAWKQELIRQVDARIGAAPVPAPGVEDFRRVSRPTHQYRRVTVSGRFLHGREALVQAVTAVGPGWWVLTPLESERGFTVLVNRGFVPRADAPRLDPPGRVTITGLLRITEPGGGFLRRNDPANDRWFSRDVAALAEARRLEDPVAPYFIDAEAGSKPTAWPRGGLTVVRFSNSHLVYALTWFGLALMSAGGAVLVVRDERRRRRRRP